MGSQPVIMLDIGSRAWTIDALSAACLMARRMDATILLVKMVPVQHIGWLGTALGYLDFTEQEQEEMAEYQELIEEYAVEYTPYVFQYLNLINGTIQIVEQFRPQMAFIKLPQTLIPMWRRFQWYRLRQQLDRLQCRLIETPLFDASDSAYTSSQADTDEWTQELHDLFNRVGHKERV
jgi:hypothetical protein